MVQSSGLTLIGYWDGPHVHGSWPRVEDFVDMAWDEGERTHVANYLNRGWVFRSFMDYSTCRVCGELNGALELSDGTYAWPEGLAHYVGEHGVRLPERFVEHVRASDELLEAAAVDSSWWASLADPGEH